MRSYLSKYNHYRKITRKTTPIKNSISISDPVFGAFADSGLPGIKIFIGLGQKYPDSDVGLAHAAEPFKSFGMGGLKICVLQKAVLCRKHPRLAIELKKVLIFRHSQRH